MHDVFRVSQQIENIQDYIVYMTKVKLLELKKITPRVDIENISVEFFARPSNKLGSYNHVTRKFKHNLYWIETHMNNPDFKQILDEHIAHEVAHVAYQNHSFHWHLVCRSIGGTGDTYFKEKSHEFECKGPYVAVCPVCERKFYKYAKPRRERPVYCGYCSSKYRRNTDAILIYKKCEC